MDFFQRYGDQVRAVWVTRYDFHTDSDVMRIMHQSAQAGFNTVFFQVLIYNFPEYLSNSRFFTLNLPALLFRCCHCLWYEGVHPPLILSWKVGSFTNTSIPMFSLSLLLLWWYKVRGNASTYFSSKIEPWSECYDWKSPGFDPLRLAIKEAHSQNMALHAWINGELLSFFFLSSSSGFRAAHIYLFWLHSLLYCQMLSTSVW
jgi:hypothetical protein